MCIASYIQMHICDYKLLEWPDKGVLCTTSMEDTTYAKFIFLLLVFPFFTEATHGGEPYNFVLCCHFYDRVEQVYFRKQYIVYL